MSVIDSTPVLTEKTNGTTTQSDEVEDVEEIVDLDPDEVASDNEDVLEGKEPGMNRRLNVALMLCHRFVIGSLLYHICVCFHVAESSTLCSSPNFFVLKFILYSC